MSKFSEEVDKYLKDRERQLSLLRKRVREIEKEEQEIARRSSQLAKEKERLASEIGMQGGDPPGINRVFSPHQPRRGRPSLNRKTWKAAALDTLKDLDRPVELSELWEAIEQTGFYSASSNKKNVLYQTLKKLREEGYVVLEGDHYRLAEAGKNA